MLAGGVDTMMGLPLHEAALAILGASFGWVIESADLVAALDARAVAA